MTALNQGTLSGFYLSLKGRNAWLKIHAWWSDELYAVRSTLIIKHKQFLEHFVETTNFSPNIDCYKYFTTFNCFFIVWNWVFLTHWIKLICHIFHSFSIANNKNLWNLWLFPSDDKAIILTIVSPVVASNLLMPGSKELNFQLQIKYTNVQSRFLRQIDYDIL